MIFAEMYHRGKKNKLRNNLTDDPYAGQVVTAQVNCAVTDMSSFNLNVNGYKLRVASF